MKSRLFMLVMAGLFLLGCVLGSVTAVAAPALESAPESLVISREDASPLPVPLVDAFTGEAVFHVSTDLGERIFRRGVSGIPLYIRVGTGSQSITPSEVIEQAQAQGMGYVETYPFNDGLSVFYLN